MRSGSLHRARFAMMTDEREVYEVAVNVDAVYADADAVAQVKAFPRASHQRVNAFVKTVIIVNQCLHGDEAFDEYVVEFNVKAEVFHVDDRDVADENICQTLIRVVSALTSLGCSFSWKENVLALRAKTYADQRYRSRRCHRDKNLPRT